MSDLDNILEIRREQLASNEKRRKAFLELQREHARYREALEDIADGSCYDTTHYIRQIARTALTGGVAKP